MISERGKIVLVGAGSYCYPPGVPSQQSPEESKIAATERIIEAIPSLPENTLFEVVEWSRQPSSHYTIQMTMDLIERLRGLIKKGARGLVVSAGTDVLEEMSYLTDLLWIYPQPVIFTGSLIPWESFGSDAAMNLYQSLLAAASENTWGLGALVCVQDQLFSATEVTKEIPQRRDAFRAPGKGPLGTIVGNQVFVKRRPHRTRSLRESITPFQNIPIFYASLGAGSFLLDHCVENPKVDGIVLAGFGLGNIPPEWLPPLKKIVKNDIPVVITSRCHQGTVLCRDNYEGGTSKILEMGILSGGSLSPAKARLRLAVGLGAGLSREELKQYLLEGS
ncbi:MAG TPA: asparaginase [Synergistaceae bacterium]|nr:asparaginase [Synergistaceae bacterium]